MFSNVNLSCWIDWDDYCPHNLSWHLNNNPAALNESNKKYKVEVKPTRSLCKREFVLSIFNVTETDEGTYSCRWDCDSEDTLEAAIALNILVQPSLTSKEYFLSNTTDFTISSLSATCPETGFELV